jgi:hypothetical protein
MRFMRAISGRLVAILDALPTWVLPSGFLLLGLYEIVVAIGDHKTYRIFIGPLFGALGIAHWLRCNNMRRRLSVLDQHIAALKAERESRTSPQR